MQTQWIIFTVRPLAVAGHRDSGDRLRVTDSHQVTIVMTFSHSPTPIDYDNRYNQCCDEYRSVERQIVCSGRNGHSRCSSLADVVGGPLPIEDAEYRRRLAG